MDPISITYQRRYGDVWVVFLSTGDELTVEAGHDEAGLAAARAAARRHIGDAAIAVERVDTTTGSIEWQGLRFEPLATTFGITAPTPAQSDQITACWEHYRVHLPPGMKVELYSNRVRIEPGAFGERAELINAVGGYLAGAVPDDQDLVVAPQTRGADHAREQFRRACAVAVPDGFVRVAQEATGFEDEGWIGTIYLVLKDRWDIDRPF